MSVLSSIQDAVASLPLSTVAITIVSGALLFKFLPRFLNRNRYAGQNKEGVVYLYQFSPKVWTTPNPSPFCLRVETYLQANNIPYENIYTLSMGPRGKLPYIRYNGNVIADR